MAKTETLTIAQEIAQFLAGELYNDNINIAFNVIKWRNLPDGVQSRLIEKYLILKGQCVFYFDKKRGYMSLPPVEQLGLNVYEEPAQWRAFGTGYQSEKLDSTNSVLIYANALRKPTAEIINYYCKILANIDLATLNNVNAVKTPFIFTGNEKQLLTMKNIYEKISGNEPVIYKDKNSGDMEFQAVPTEATFIADKLLQLYILYDARIKTLLGIDNLQTQKKERLITDEANANNETINAHRVKSLETRQEAATAINKLYGLNITVDYNAEIEDLTPDNDEDDETPDDEDNTDDNTKGATK